MVFLTGTDTDVGKTFITKGLVYCARYYDINAISYKPIESGGVIRNGIRVSSDVEKVIQLSGLHIDNQSLNSYCLSKPLSPHLALEKDGVEFELGRIINKYKSLSKSYKSIVVEGAGGICVPIVRNEYYMYNLIKDLGLEVILVTRTKLGTINHTMLSVNFLKSLGIDIRAIVFSGYTGEEMEDDNIKIIMEVSDIKKYYVIDKVPFEDVKLIRDEFLKKFTKADVEYLLK